MGQNADELAKTAQISQDAVDQSEEDVANLRTAATSLDQMSQDLHRMSADLGIEGDSADAAGIAFRDLASTLATNADDLDRAVGSATSARQAIVTARQSFAELPGGDLSPAQKAAIAAGGTIVMPGVGTVVAAVAAEIWGNQREEERESAAQQALLALQQDMSSAQGQLYGTDVADGRENDPTDLPDRPGPDGPGTGPYTPPGGPGGPGAPGGPGGPETRNRG